jgi:hypothetical protein
MTNPMTQNKSGEHDAVRDSVLRALDDSIQGMDYSTLAKLNQRRQLALSHASQNPLRRLWILALPATGLCAAWVVWMFAAPLPVPLAPQDLSTDDAAVLAELIPDDPLPQATAPDPHAATSITDTEMLELADLSVEELNVVQDLEFYAFVDQIRAL